MKTSWKGALAFGLVSIEVELYSAIQPHTIGFKLVHAKCHTPITYKKWCSHCNQEVEWSEIDKAIQLKDGTYFIITPENLKKLRPKKTDTISIVEFVGHDAIDEVLYDTHYYVVPSKAPYHAFFLFAAALADLHKVAIGQFALRDKEYVCAIRPYRNFLLLTTLNYAYEVKKLAKMEEIEAPAMNAKELKLAEELINKLSKKKFDITKYKDTFATALVAKISQLKKGVPIPQKKKEVEKPKEVSLMKALEASLGAVQAGSKARVK